MNTPDAFSEQENAPHGAAPARRIRRYNPLNTRKNGHFGHVTDVAPHRAYPLPNRMAPVPDRNQTPGEPQMSLMHRIAIVALPLAAACARGGEADADAALVDTANSAVITGDTAAAATVPLTRDTAVAATPGATTEGPAPVAETHGDSAAH